MIDRSTLPYIDRVLDYLDKSEEVISRRLGNNLHWGYWEDPDHPDLSERGIHQAARGLNEQLFTEAALADGVRILDVGCGIGGAMAQLNERYRDLHLVGLNIDRRQLAIASQHVQPKNSNTVECVAADACSLPFADESFDTIFAIECIFHFASKRGFLREAHRVLRPGGRLVFSDFLVFGPGVPLTLILTLFHLKDLETAFGRASRDPQYPLLLYRCLALAQAWRIRAARDITHHTLPTYTALAAVFKGATSMDEKWAIAALKANRFLETLSRLGLLRYYVLALEK